MISMGQYYIVSNVDKREYIDPQRVGSGLKLWEICSSNLPRLLPYLLRQSTGTGMGDPDGVHVGHWAGDRVVIVGDYDESDTYGGLFREATDSQEWTEISPYVVSEFNSFIERDKFKIGTSPLSDVDP